MTALENLQYILAGMHRDALRAGSAAKELWDGFNMVWVEAKRAERTHRINWQVAECRARREEIPRLLGISVERSDDSEHV